MKVLLLSTLFCLISFVAFAQKIAIGGKVTDQNGKPVPFANVYVKNTTNGASANSEGDYRNRYENWNRSPHGDDLPRFIVWPHPGMDTPSVG